MNKTEEPKDNKVAHLWSDLPREGKSPARIAAEDIADLIPNLLFPNMVTARFEGIVERACERQFEQAENWRASFREMMEAYQQAEAKLNYLQFAKRFEFPNKIFVERNGDNKESWVVWKWQRVNDTERMIYWDGKEWKWGVSFWPSVDAALEEAGRIT